METKSKGERRKAKVVCGYFSLFPFLFSLGCVVAAGNAPAWAASTYPTKPIRIVVTYAPGGNTDTAARIVSTFLAENLGQTFIIDNRGGAGGVVGTEIVARAVPDGYTLLFGTSAGLSINPQLQPKLPYNVERDFAPISLVLINPQLLVSSPSLPAGTLGEFTLEELLTLPVIIVITGVGLLAAWRATQFLRRPRVALTA